MAFDSKDSKIKIITKNTNTANTPNELGLQINTQNVVLYFKKKKYTLEPFESKCFLSLFITVEADGYHYPYPVFFCMCI